MEKSFIFIFLALFAHFQFTSILCKIIGITGSYSATASIKQRQLNLSQSQNSISIPLQNSNPICVFAFYNSPINSTQYYTDKIISNIFVINGAVYATVTTLDFVSGTTQITTSSIASSSYSIGNSTFTYNMSGYKFLGGYWYIIEA